MQKFNDLEEKGHFIRDYISNFDQKYQKIDKTDMNLTQEILAFKLLKQTQLSKEESWWVLTGIKYDSKNMLYDQAKKSPRKFKEDNVSSEYKINQHIIKIEPPYLAENEDVVLVAGYVHRSRLSNATAGLRRNYYQRGRGKDLIWHHQIKVYNGQN